MKLSVYFYLNNIKDEKADLMCTVQYNKSRDRFATGLKVKLSDWDFENKKLKKSTNFSPAHLQEYIKINGRIADIETEIPKMIARCEIMEVTPEKSDFTQIIKGEDNKEFSFERSLISYFDKYIDIKKNNTLEFSEKTAENNTTTRNHMASFIGGKKVMLEDVNMEFVSAFVNFLSDKKDISDATISNSYLKDLKAFMRFALRQEWTKNFNGSLISLNRKKETNFALTLNELMSIHDYEPDEIKLRQARNLFVLQSFQGLRISELFCLNKESFNFETDEISFYEIKKKRWHTRPLLPVTKEFYTNVLSDEGIPIMDKKTYNMRIKKVCYHSGVNRLEQMGRLFKGELRSNIVPIHQSITSHHARATFITLSTEMGLKDEDTMLCTGITNVKTLQGYKRLLDANKVRRLNDTWNMGNIRELQKQYPN